MGKLWYIRHGQTNFNFVNQQWHELGDPEDQAGFQYIPDYIDPGLNEVGTTQAASRKSEILQLPVDIVHVSPMLRALETCWHIFGTIENPPKIIVNPLFTEWLHVNHDVPAYPNDHIRVRFHTYDWSLVPEYYYPVEIINEKYRENVVGDLPSHALLKTMQSILPDLVESRYELFNRTRRAKEFLRKEITDKNVAVVGHSAFYRHFTSEIGDDGEFYGQKILTNGECTEITEF